MSEIPPDFEKIGALNKKSAGKLWGRYLLALARCVYVSTVSEFSLASGHGKDYRVMP